MAELTLFVTDAEMIRRLGVPEKIARAAIRALDRDRGSGFPPKRKLWGDRRYWPAVQQWCDRAYGGPVRAQR
ncbi:winged helix-turn-helix domain-containing protein [Bradyrhizobium sp. HKCCYLS2033]|uniref:winged helix-turn-helix domain-containing protein n=1 Tax=Bradyrhizobium sp. HKCCYLS2033 TaxID=3420739 RepID=UPI003EBCFC7F